MATDLFPLDQPTATQACTVELNKGRRKERGLRSTAVDAEQAGFPFAAQVARVRRRLQAHQPEKVSLITELSSAELDASAWLKFNHQAWGIEAGLHQRLNVSHNDDRCRVLHPGAMLVFSLLRRLANRVFIEWRYQFPKPDQKTTTDFQSHLN